jgi:hypothetical protein
MHKLLLGFCAVVLSSAALAQDSTSSSSTPPPVAEGAAPSATVSLSGGAVAVGVGYVWGHGTLDFTGKHYAFKLKGISVVDVGAADDLA